VSDEEFDRRLRNIAALAKKQKEGSYTTQSDAWMALESIETLALLLIESHEAKHGNPTPTARTA
jgi:hypothetical protein